MKNPNAQKESQRTCKSREVTEMVINCQIWQHWSSLCLLNMWIYDKIHLNSTEGVLVIKTILNWLEWKKVGQTFIALLFVVLGNPW